MKLAGLFGIAVLLTVLTARLYGPVDTDDPSLVFPGLKEALPTLAGLTVKSLEPGGQTITINRSGDQWLLEERSRYPADFDALSRFLGKLADLHIAEQKTSNREYHARLGVADDGDGAGILVTLSPGNFSLIAGNDAESRGSFFRYQDTDQVYLTSEPLEVSTDVLSWTNPVFINVEPAEVMEVSIATREAEYLSARRDEASGELELADIPEGGELKYDSVVDSLARLLVNVRMQDVEPYRAETFDDPTTTRLTLASGEVIEVRTIRQESAFWMHVGRDGLSAWQFRVSEFTWKEFNKTMQDLLKATDTDAG